MKRSTYDDDNNNDNNLPGSPPSDILFELFFKASLHSSLNATSKQKFFAWFNFFTSEVIILKILDEHAFDRKWRLLSRVRLIG